MDRHASWRDPPPAFDSAPYPESVLRRASAGWTRLYLDERDSLLAASYVLADLTRLGAPHALLARASRVIEDEARHVTVCAHVLDQLGADPAPVPLAETRPPPSGDLAARQAKMLIQGFAVGESMSAAAFAAARERCAEPLARWAYTELLRDETRHGIFGADAGGWVLARHPEIIPTELWPGCVAEMVTLERRVGGPYDEHAREREGLFEHADDLERLGLLRGSLSCDAFERAIQRWVVPRLAKLGVTVEA